MKKMTKEAKPFYIDIFNSMLNAAAKGTVQEVEAAAKECERINFDIKRKNFLTKFESSTAIGFAVLFDNVNAVRVLLEKGCDVNDYIYQHGTPFARAKQPSLLIQAIRNWNAELVEILLNAGADVDAKDLETKETALKAAQKTKQKEIIKLIKKASSAAV